MVTVSHEPLILEVGSIGGLAPLVRAELVRRFGRGVTFGTVADAPLAASLTVEYVGDWRELLHLRLAASVWLVEFVAVPRPKALLGDQHFRLLVGLVRAVVGLHPAGAFGTLALAAAGADSAVMQRLQAELAGAVGLQPVVGRGDLMLRLRRPRDGRPGWEVLVRLTPRPMATRVWRVRNWPGALDATIAAAMADLLPIADGDILYNLACGSGTLLAEALLRWPGLRGVGCDTDVAVLADARANLTAAGVAARSELQLWDATRLPLADGSVDHLCADLPFGQLVGSHATNELLYPALLAEAARVARPGGHFALITHELRLLERVLRAQPAWRVAAEYPISIDQRLRPRVYLLVRL